MLWREKKCPKKLQSSAPHQTKGLTLVEAGECLEILLSSVRYNFWSQKLPLEEYYLRNYDFFLAILCNCIFGVILWLNNFGVLESVPPPSVFSLMV